MQPSLLNGRWLSPGILIFFAFISGAHAQEFDTAPLSASTGICGELKTHFGPFDYRTATPDQKYLVERAHFTPRVERLKGGSTGQIGHDIAYTLHVFPNHYRALYAVSRYTFLHHTTQLPGMVRPAECYFDRALRFTPDDPQVRALYADFLIHWNRPREAQTQLETAEKSTLSAENEYNIALAWANLGKIERALPLAKSAYSKGIKFPGLREKLKAAGVWQD